MASSTKFVCLFFLLTTLLCSLQIHARDSQFFSKVSRERDATTNPTKNLYNNNANEAETFSKVQKPEEEPVFTPQTTGNGYGLYGHETGLDAPSTTPTTLYNMDDTNKFEYDTKFYDNNINNEKHNPFNYNNENNEFAQTKYFNNNNNEKQNSFANNDEFAQTKYFNEKQNSYANNDEFAQTKYFSNNNEKQDSFNANNNELFDETKYFNNNNNNNNNYDQEKYFSNNNEEQFDKYLNGNNENQKAFTNNNLYDREKNYAPELKGLSEFSYKSKVGPSKYLSNSNNGGVERQGMSDTRYLENGKYYFDINSEKKFDNTNNNYMSYNNNNNNYGNNNHGEYYKNNNYNGNAMQKESFKNQFPEEGEFDFDDQP